MQTYTVRNKLVEIGSLFVLEIAWNVHWYKEKEVYSWTLSYYLDHIIFKDLLFPLREIVIRDTKEQESEKTSDEYEELRI